MKNKVVVIEMSLLSISISMSTTRRDYDYCNVLAALPASPLTPRTTTPAVVLIECDRSFTDVPQHITTEVSFCWLPVERRNENQTLYASSSINGPAIGYRT